MEPERGPGGARLRPLPFRQLIRRMGEEYRNAGSIFGIPEPHFFRKSGGRRAELVGEGCDLPLGPAAGPHTQLAQNIVAAWLAGARFFELKTVQKLDALRIAKPCIDASDGGFNTEWSTELSLEQALGEYVKAWAALHLLEEALGLGRAGEERSFLFDLSVGYDLEGIRSPAMDRFIDGLADASRLPVFRSCLEELAGLPAGWGGLPRPVRLEALLPRVSPRICRSVSLSTMHGCPPGEIEAICLHLLENKNLATLLKLNPTLVGLRAGGGAAAGGRLGRPGAGRGELPPGPVGGGRPAPARRPARPRPRGGPALRGQADQHPRGGQHPRGAAR